MSRPKTWEMAQGNELWLQMFQQTPFKNELNQLNPHCQWRSQSRLAYKLQSWQKEPLDRIAELLEKPQTPSGVIAKQYCRPTI